MSTHKKAVKAHGSRIILFLIAFVVIIYLAVSIFFLGHFCFGTEINGMDVAGKSAAAVEDMIRTESNGYILQVKGREESGGNITAAAIGLNPVFDGTIENLLEEQNAFAWPASLFKKTELEAESVVQYDENSLKESIRATGVFDDQRKPVNAELSEYQDGGYTIIPEDQGTTLVESKVWEAAENAVISLSDILDLEADGCYEAPEITSDDQTLNELMNNLNKFVQVKLSIPFGNETEIIDGEKIGEWIDVAETSVSLNTAKVKEYVDSLARAHDTFGRNREFKTTSGKTITVSGGDYGWWTDRPSTTQALVEAITSGQSGEFKPVYFAEAAQYGDSDIGNSYVEADLDNQKVYVYKDGELVVQTDCVSGKAVAGRFTPDGTYGITYKEKDATLVGEGYSSPVKYWMPFNGNIGLHDASWRNKFGGDIYLTNGSHGCLNLPTSKAAEIYDCVEKGEPVIVYGGVQSAPKKELTEEEQQQLLLQQMIDAGLLPAPATDGNAEENGNTSNDAAENPQ
ncbi:Putative peptidoglycan binding domain-containing protein [Lachnospiraceae bacterium]|nr:Putative peptidoglycan binding domain-containing protein [Lachnospiraceae bacterium]